MSGEQDMSKRETETLIAFSGATYLNYVPTLPVRMYVNIKSPQYSRRIISTFKEQ